MKTAWLSEVEGEGSTEPTVVLVERDELEQDIRDVFDIAEEALGMRHPLEAAAMREVLQEICKEAVKAVRNRKPSDRENKSVVFWYERGKDKKIHLRSRT